MHATQDTVNYKKDWTNRKSFYIIKMRDGSQNFFLKINERRLVTEDPYTDLISSLEQMIADAKEMQRSATA